MLQRYLKWGGTAFLLLLVLVQVRSVSAQQYVNPDAIAMKLNRDSFELCREVRTQFRGIRGGRSLFAKAYEVHEMADKVHRMIVLNAPVQGMDQALWDLNGLVDDLDRSLHSRDLPVLRDPVLKPTGPNGYIFYGGNGYPQPCFQCNGFPYRMIPEQRLRAVDQTLNEMKSSIGLLIQQYSPQSRSLPEQRRFPTPQLGAPVELETQPRLTPVTPRRDTVPIEPEFDSNWKPSRQEPLSFPEPIPPNSSAPKLQGPQFLPPMPNVN